MSSVCLPKLQTLSIRVCFESRSRLQQTPYLRPADSASFLWHQGFDLPTVCVSTKPYLAQCNQCGESSHVRYSGYLPSINTPALSDGLNVNLTCTWKNPLPAVALKSTVGKFSIEAFMCRFGTCWSCLLSFLFVGSDVIWTKANNYVWNYTFMKVFFLPCSFLFFVFDNIPEGKVHCDAPTAPSNVCLLDNAWWV